MHRYHEITVFHTADHIKHTDFKTNSIILLCANGKNTTDCSLLVLLSHAMHISQRPYG